MTGSNSRTGHAVDPPHPPPWWGWAANGADHPRPICRALRHSTRRFARVRRVRQPAVAAPILTTCGSWRLGAAVSGFSAPAPPIALVMLPVPRTADDKHQLSSAPTESPNGNQGAKRINSQGGGERSRPRRSRSLTDPTQRPPLKLVEQLARISHCSRRSVLVSNSANPIRHL